MSSTWHRSTASIAARFIVLITLLVAIVVSGDSLQVPPMESADRSIGPATTEAAISVSLSTAVARPGQRIGVQVLAGIFPDRATDVALLGNGISLEVQALSAQGSAYFEVDVPSTGPIIYGAELRDRSNKGLLTRDETAAILNVALNPSVLVLSDQQSAYASSLRQGDWQVLEQRPANFAADTSPLASASMLVLDDVSIADLPAAIWDEIHRSVRQGGLGLLVLGGPNSFALGAYRESRLESLLPVVSEPPNYEPPASVVFLVDVSGSMDQAVAAGNRLQVARQAVTESSSALRAIDHVGLMSFDIAVREHLSLAARTNHSEAIAQSWPMTASGGTRLLPAIENAIDVLEHDPNTHDVLVVLTDGNISQTDLDELALVLRSTTVELIALVVADADDHDADALIRIIEESSGTAIQIDNVLQLPSIMRSELEKNRPAIVFGSSALSVTSPADWMSGNAMPAVAAYALTRPREEATVNIVSGRGDVIMASMNAGAGEVIAVTSGLSSWARDWLQSDGWPEFAANLTRRLATRESPAIDVSVNHDDSGVTTLIIEQSDRQSLKSIRGTLVGPSNSLTMLKFHPVAVGRYSSELQLTESGQYLVTLDDGLTTARHHFQHKQEQTGAILPGLEAAKLSRQVAWERLLACLALLLFLTVLWWERR